MPRYDVGVLSREVRISKPGELAAGGNELKLRETCVRDLQALAGNATAWSEPNASLSLLVK